MTDVNAMNARVQEQARIREGVAKIEGRTIDGESYIKRAEVLRIIRDGDTM